MFYVTSLWLCWTLLSVSVVGFTCAGQKNITAESGQNITLTCRAPNNNITAIEWKRADLGEQYVLLYRQKHFDTAKQHPSFKNRVDLQDRQMKDGDVSLILKDVTINDTGTYKFRVYTRGENQNNAPEMLLSIIYLHVDPPGQTGGDTEDGGKEDGGKLLWKSLTVAAKVMKLLVLVERGRVLFMELLAMVARGSQLFRELLALVAKVMELLEELGRGMVLLQDLVELVF